MPADLDRLAGHQAGQVLAGALAEGLAALGGVDAGQADTVLDPVVVEDGQGVAVGDVDDTAFEEIGEGRGAASNRQVTAGSRQSQDAIT